MRHHKDIDYVLNCELRIVDEEFDDLSEQDTHLDLHFELAHIDEEDTTIH